MKVLKMRVLMKVRIVTAVSVCLRVMMMHLHRRHGEVVERERVRVMEGSKVVVKVVRRGKLRFYQGNLLYIHYLEVDFKVPKTHPFQPLRPVGPHLPATIQVSSPAELFKLYFDSGIVVRICDATNEYAERNKEKAVMYRYYTPMTPDDFYAFVGIFVHLGYRKIPRYRLMWSPTSLCYDLGF